jgi:hypothetical protein
MRASLVFTLAVSLAGCAAADDASSDDAGADKSDTTISKRLCL